MKKLKCKSCLNIWYIDDYRLNDQNYCPCCCAKITKEVSLGDIDTPPKAIYDYIIQYGIDKLKDPESLINYLHDMCPDMKKELRLLSRALRDYRDEIFKLFNAELSETDNLLNSLKYHFINYDEMSEQGANIICENLNSAVMLYKGKNPPVVMSVEVSDVSDISEKTETQTFEEEQTEEKSYSELEIISSGECGENAEWVLYKDGTLVISGSGEMYDYQWFNNKITTDWYNDRKYIKKIQVKEGITSIGDYAFAGCENLKNITVSDSVQLIGRFAFYNCYNLKNITVPDSIQSICDCAFYDCISLKKIEIPVKLKKYMSNWNNKWKHSCSAKIIYI